MTTRIEYIANNDSKKVLEDVIETACDKFAQHFSNKESKYFQIERGGLYPLLQVCCRGKCNTYWRTVGRYPQVIEAKNIVVAKSPAPKYSEEAYNNAVQALAEQCVAMAKEDYKDPDDRKFHAIEYVGDSLQDLNSAVDKLLK